MSRSTPARRRPLLAVLAAALLLLAACGGGGGSDDGGDGSKATTTAASSTKAGGGKDGGSKRPASIQEFGKALEGAGFDDEQLTCILDVAQGSLASGGDADALDKAYTDKCGLSNSEVVAGAYYSFMVDKGIPEKDADCVRDLFAALTAEQAAVFSDDTEARDSLLTGCNIDPAEFFGEG